MSSDVQEPEQSEPSSDVQEQPPDKPSEEGDGSEGKALGVYFSATGNTKAVAETLAGLQSADLYEIVPEQPYTDEDLNYNNRNTRATVEQNDPDARPAIQGSITDFEQYDVVYVGFPIWWGDMPRILYTFFDTYDLRMPGQMEQEKGAAYEIHKTGKFRVERVPYLYGMHGVWRCGKRTAFVDA